jgi:hypothetical protein
MDFKEYVNAVVALTNLPSTEVIIVNIAVLQRFVHLIET